MKIFLDDERHPQDWVGYDGEWNVVRNYNEFKEILLNCYHQNIDIECISFDHDLGEDSKDGYDCAKWLTEQYIVIPEVWAHSMNTPGKLNILSIMK
ncbi:MAG: cyclic-phosphate processing receiver domain-containing protein, partial [Candidatus Heimdallarchaeota archaeon]